MHLFCLLDSQDPLLTKLRKCLGTILDGVQIDYFFTLNSLMTQLRDPACFARTVLMVVADPKILDDLLEQREVLSSLPMVLLVDDEEEDNVAKGHLLRPRLMTGLDCEPEPVIEVLSNLLRMQRQSTLPAVGCFLGR